jgi:hypothetical protein
MAPKDVAPSLFVIASRKNGTVKQALSKNTWMIDLRHGLTQDMLPELLNLVRLVMRYT